MMHSATRFLLAIAILASAWTLYGTPSYANDGLRLVIGRISQEPRKHYARLQAMADYLALQLAGRGVSGVDVVMVSSPDRMRKLLEEGKVDILSETPFVALELEEAGLVSLLLREWKKGVPEYRTLIVARRDGPVNELKDMVGHRFAFEDPGSTSGYLIPRAALEAASLNLTALDNPRDPVPEGTVGYSFARGEINVVAWVNRGLAEAGALSNLDWYSPKSAPEHLKQELKIIHETDPVIRSLLMVRSAVDEALQREIKEVLLHMHLTRAGRETLKSYFRVQKYDELEGDALAGLETARKIWKQVHGGLHN